jgi:hypothetical protein
MGYTNIIANAEIVLHCLREADDSDAISASPTTKSVTALLVHVIWHAGFLAFLSVLVAGRFASNRFSAVFYLLFHADLWRTEVNRVAILSAGGGELELTVRSIVEGDSAAKRFAQSAGLLLPLKSEKPEAPQLPNEEEEALPCWQIFTSKEVPAVDWMTPPEETTSYNHSRQIAEVTTILKNKFPDAKVFDVPIIEGIRNKWYSAHEIHSLLYMINMFNEQCQYYAAETTDSESREKLAKWLMRVLKFFIVKPSTMFTPDEKDIPIFAWSRFRPFGFEDCLSPAVCLYVLRSFANKVFKIDLDSYLSVHVPQVLAAGYALGTMSTQNTGKLIDNLRRACDIYLRESISPIDRLEIALGGFKGAIDEFNALRGSGETENSIAQFMIATFDKLQAELRGAISEFAKNNFSDLFAVTNGNIEEIIQLERFFVNDKETAGLRESLGRFARSTSIALKGNQSAISPEACLYLEAECKSVMQHCNSINAMPQGGKPGSGAIVFTTKIAEYVEKETLATVEQFLRVKFPNDAKKRGDLLQEYKGGKRTFDQLLS